MGKMFVSKWSLSDTGQHFQSEYLMRVLSCLIGINYHDTKSYFKPFLSPRCSPVPTAAL
jgi:hypothetical protein